MERLHFARNFRSQRGEFLETWNFSTETLIVGFDAMVSRLLSSHCGVEQSGSSLGS